MTWQAGSLAREHHASHLYSYWLYKPWINLLVALGKHSRYSKTTLSNRTNSLKQQAMSVDMYLYQSNVSGNDRIYSCSGLGKWVPWTDLGPTAEVPPTGRA